MQLLALSGSLRADSTNTALLRAAARQSPSGVAVTLYDELAALPAFNPDLDTEPAPAAVARFRFALRAANGVLIACPEYAHGVPGALKNTLDWVVASGEFARAALTEILVTMSARLIDTTTLTVPLLGKTADEAAAILAAPGTTSALRDTLQRFCLAIDMSVVP
ncbi:NAD(P)H-dependent oxidoreductase [Neisseriaceae bacterium JH1-16]|nr:NAD(P)H-dependent oxidoreductase [Neisseriaceae bacterium JH1-16]